MGELPERVRFVENQVLRTRDLSDDADYAREMSRRHNVGPHEWGIVSGLVPVVAGAQVVVERGTAIDGFGRFLVLTENQRADGLDLSLESTRRTGAYDLWLEYARQDATRGRAAGACRRAAEGSREVEGPKVVAVPTVGQFDPRDPPGAAPADRGFGPDRRPPDEPDRRWPVFLGHATFDPIANAWSVELARRPYVGLIAERVRVPFVPGGAANCNDSATQFVQIGKSEKPDTNDYRFGVFFDDGPENDPKVPWLGVTGNGHVNVNGGELAVHGDVALFNGGGIEFQPNRLARAPKTENVAANEPEPEVDAAGWQIYRHLSLQPAAGAGDDDEAKITTDELRVVLPAAQAGGAVPKFVVGAAGADGAFKGILEVHQFGDQGVVRVRGNLVVDGLYDGPAPVTGGTDLATLGDPDATNPADDALLNIVLEHWLDAAPGAEHIADRLWHAGTGPGAIGAKMPDDVPLEPFAGAILSKPNGSEAVAEALPDDFNDDAQTVLARVAKGALDKARGSSALATTLLGAPKLADVAGKVLAERLTGFDVVSPVFITNLPKDNTPVDQTALRAIADGVRNQPRGPAAIAGALLADPLKLSAVAGTVLAEREAGFDVVCPRFIDNLPDQNDNAAQTTLKDITAKILERNRGPAAVDEALRGNIPALGVVLGKLLNTDDGITAAGDHLPDSPRLDILARKLLGRDNGSAVATAALVATDTVQETLAAMVTDGAFSKKMAAALPTAPALPPPPPPLVRPYYTAFVRELQTVARDKLAEALIRLNFTQQEGWLDVARSLVKTGVDADNVPLEPHVPLGPTVTVVGDANKTLAFVLFTALGATASAADRAAFEMIKAAINAVP